METTQQKYYGHFEKYYQFSTIHHRPSGVTPFFHPFPYIQFLNVFSFGLKLPIWFFVININFTRYSCFGLTINVTPH